MADEVSMAELRERLHNYSLVSYTQVSGLMLSGIFALGAITLLDILRNSDHRLLRLSFWLMMTAGEFVATIMQMQRPALMWRSGILEVPSLVARGMVSLIGYAIIAPQSGGTEGWRYAYAIGLFVAATSYALERSFSRALSSAAYAPDVDALLQPVRTTHLRQRQSYVYIGIVVMILLALTSCAPADWIFVEWIALAYNLGATALICMLGLRFQRAWTDFETAVFGTGKPIVRHPGRDLPT